MPRKTTEINPKAAVRLKELIDEQGIKQSKLAERAELSENIVSRIVRGKAPLTSTVAQAIAHAFPGVRAAYLMGLDDFKTTEEETLYPVAKEMTDRRSRTKAVDFLLATLGVFIEPNEEKYPVFPEAGKLMQGEMDTDKCLEMVGKIYDASIRPDAFIINRNGERAGYCNESRRKALYDEIIDFSEYLISKLCREEAATNGKPD